MQLSAGAFCFALVVGVLAWSHPVDRDELIDTFGALARTER